MCYCHGSGDELKAAVDKATAEIDEYGATLKSESAEKAQTALDLTQHKKDRETATADLETNLKGLAGAIPALEKGMGGASFVQLPVASQIRKLVESSPAIGEMDKRNVISFLDQSGGSSGEEYQASSGEIVGILKAMEDDMKKNLED